MENLMGRYGLATQTDKQMSELQDPRCHLEIGGDVYVTAKTWDGMLNIHIRKYDVYPNGKSYPTKRGIVLSLKHWVELCAVFTLTDEATGKDFKHHLGANVFVVMDDTGISVQQWCWDKDSLVPTAKGILLSQAQWKKLRDCVEVMPEFVPELNDMVSCIQQEDHQNQVGALRCAFCNPNDYMNW